MQDQCFAVKRNLSHQTLFRDKTPLLSHLDIELTERCNNACMHCYINLPAHDIKAVNQELTTGQWKDIIKQAAALGALTIRFTGGEPLLRDDFTELYLYTRRLGIRVMLFTNARLITPELADLFARVPPLKKIEVSVYGMHSKSYDTVSCVSGAYAEFRRGVDMLLQRQVPFVVKSVLLPPNRDERAEFEAWAATLPGMNHRPSYSIFLDLRTRRDSPAKDHLIKELRFSPEEGLKILTKNEDEFCKDMTIFCSKFLGHIGDQLFNCGAGETGCVDAYGMYQMCMLLRHPDTLYDLSKGTLREALIEFFPLQRMLRATNQQYIERCARCFLKGLCEQCPAKSWSEHGTLDTPVEYLCQLAHAQARYL
ncbi:MAG: radical SAM protein, partial [Anaerolineales bacterium]|nr:radical SAM protein [Anaerolineales bacterium]